ncbi:MAG TPA: TetR/AcrR family transcriptional regulator [Burkholderiaceae bacterium]|nr:TetR/AcrR family transcriptional regulator [Burkholderiaceae bacterium]
MSTRVPQRTYGGVSAGERIAARRAKLLDAGLDLFGTQGFAATGVKDICRTAGLTDRYFYESFADSEALFLAVFDGLTDELFRSVAEAVVAGEDDAESQLRNAISVFIQALAADPRKPRVLFTEAAAAGPSAAAHMRTTLRRFAELVAATARHHLPAATPDADVQLVSLSLVGLLERVITEREAGALEIPVDRLVDRCVALYLLFLGAVSDEFSSPTPSKGS